MITNPQAIRFSNRKARAIATATQTLYRTILQFQQDVVRDFEALTGSDQDGDTIDDGAASQGIPIVTKGNVAELKFVMEQVKDCLETDDRLALLNKWVDQSTPLY